MLSALRAQDWHRGLVTPCQAAELGEGQRLADGVQGCGYQWLSQGCHTSTQQPLLNLPCLSPGPGSGWHHLPHGGPARGQRRTQGLALSRLLLPGSIYLAVVPMVGRGIHLGLPPQLIRAQHPDGL